MLFVDSHVHIYDCFDLREFLEAAAANFSTWAKTLECKETHFMLCLTEDARSNAFQAIPQLINDGQLEPWNIRETEEADSFLLENGHTTLILIGGRQVITEDKIEVLAIGHSGAITDGQGTIEILKYCAEHARLTILPWGAGKWLGKRGRIVANLIEDKTLSFSLGDNSGRLRHSPPPRHFRLAENCNRAVLPGSDPLPIKSEYWRPGSYGTLIDTQIDIRRPAQSLQQAIRDKHPIRPYGQREGFGGFLRNQLIMQLVKPRSPAHGPS